MSWACSPPVTCRTTSTARRSPPQGRGAWRPSMPSAGSSSSPEPPPTGRSGFGIPGPGQECQHRSGTFQEQAGTMPADPRRDPLPMESTLTALTDATFEEEVNASDQPVLVDFWAEWCGPCKLINPILEDLATEYDGRLRIVKVDVDESPDVARRYELMRILTLVLFQEGVAKKRMIGAKGKGQLVQELAEFL